MWFNITLKERLCLFSMHVFTNLAIKLLKIKRKWIQKYCSAVLQSDHHFCFQLLALHHHMISGFFLCNVKKIFIQQRGRLSTGIGNFHN
jgi:hypothetical protein